MCGPTSALMAVAWADPTAPIFSGSDFQNGNIKPSASERLLNEKYKVAYAGMPTTWCGVLTSKETLKRFAEGLSTNIGADAKALNPSYVEMERALREALARNRLPIIRVHYQFPRCRKKKVDGVLVDAASNEMITYDTVGDRCSDRPGSVESGHWVVVTGIDDNEISINDPGFKEASATEPRTALENLYRSGVRKYTIRSVLDAWAHNSKTGNIPQLVLIWNKTGGSESGLYGINVPKDPIVITAGSPINVTITPMPASTPVTYIKPPSWPSGLNISSDGVISGVLSDIKDFILEIFTVKKAEAAGPGDINTRANGYITLSVRPPTEDAHKPQFMTASMLPNGTVGQAYTVAFAASHSTGIQSFEFGGLPAGFTSSANRITGTPARTGDYVVRLIVTAGSGAKAAKDFTLHVGAATSTTTGPRVSGIQPSPVAGTGLAQDIKVYGSDLGAITSVSLRNVTAGSTHIATATSIDSGAFTFSFAFPATASEWAIEAVSATTRSSAFGFNVVPSSGLSPSISALSPNPVTGQNAQQTVTVTGANFSAGSSVTLRDKTNGGTFHKAGVLASATELSFSANFTTAAATWSIAVVNADGKTSAEVDFEVRAPTSLTPSLTSITPSTYTTMLSNQTMTLSGGGFQAGATLAFVTPGGVAIASSASKLTFVSDSQLRYQFNSGGEAGTWRVRVNSADGLRHSAELTFTVTPTASAPTISSVSPSIYAANSANQTMTISGSNFVSGATLIFDPPTGSNISSTPAKLTFVSASEIRYEFNNAGDAGAWTVAVKNPDGQQSTARGFTVSATPAAAPTISSVSPSSYPANTSNQTMTINGANFVSGATLTFDPPTGSNIESSASKLTFVSSTRITYEINNGGDAGQWTVRVNNPDGQRSSAASFTVAASTPAPSISSVSPSSYPANTSNQTMTINGSNFVSGATLTFNPPTGSNIDSTPSKLTFNSSSRITYQFNNGNDAGEWTVRVTNPDGQRSSAESFTVASSAPAPSISSISPSSFTASNSNQTMTINGSNFVEGATLTFNPPTGSNIDSTPSKLTFNSSSKITYLFNNGSDRGTWTVTVNNPDGQESSAKSFTVN
jgi:hypothetical protein